MSSLPRGRETHEGSQGSSSSMSSRARPFSQLRERQGNASAMSTPSSSGSSRRSVSFSPETSGRIISSHHDMTEDEKAATWLTEDETKAGQQDLIKSVLAARRGQQVAAATTSGQQGDDDDTLCIRGLEHLVSPQRLRDAQDQRNDLIDGILDEQDRHWKLGNDRAVDPDALWVISEALTRENVARAIDLAASDADSVQNLR